jgi:sec-independent protein translocase protein TatB
MPSLGDSAFIFLLALLLFGPKKLPELARQIGKLMGEFRRASTEFRLQMEEELRVADQNEKQKKIAELQAAAPVAPATDAEPKPVYDTSDHPRLRTAVQDPEGAAIDAAGTSDTTSTAAAEPPSIATAGDVTLHPPATGLPTPHTSSSSASSLAPFINAVPRAETTTAATPAETQTEAPAEAPAASEETLHG